MSELICDTRLPLQGSNAEIPKTSFARQSMRGFPNTTGTSVAERRITKPKQRHGNENSHQSSRKRFPTANALTRSFQEMRKVRRNGNGRMTKKKCCCQV